MSRVRSPLEPQGTIAQLGEQKCFVDPWSSRPNIALSETMIAWSNPGECLWDYIHQRGAVSGNHTRLTVIASLLSQHLVARSFYERALHISHPQVSSSGLSRGPSQQRNDRKLRAICCNDSLALWHRHCGPMGPGHKAQDDTCGVARRRPNQNFYPNGAHQMMA